MWVGDTRPAWAPTVLGDNNVPINFQANNVTAGMLSMVIRNTATGQDQPLQGTISIIDPVNGIIQVLWSPADTAYAGSFQILLTVNFPAPNPGPQTFGPFALVINPK